MSNLAKNLILWAMISVTLMAVFNNFAPVRVEPAELSYSEFIAGVKNGQVRNVYIDPDKRLVTGTYQDGSEFRTNAVSDPKLVDDLLANNVAVAGSPRETPSVFMEFLLHWFPLLLLIGVWIFFMRQMQGGQGRGAMSFGKSRARLTPEDQNTVTFDDVAGIEEAKDEVQELVEFLREPKKFQNLGGQIPRGVLMVGSPGTGKTLLARAIAGEAKVPFFSISGSDFVEMFVGVGASRVRDMFGKAKEHAPSIVFIDEIDAVGRHRGAGLGGGHDEREQTLNQLLVEMDGFEGNEGVIIIAATNRPDVLDPALLRPGRFDRQVVVPLPDIRGREQILNVHTKKVPLEEDVKTSVIARGTPGFSGADLANLVNEAALYAARQNQEKVKMQDFEYAQDKIMMGSERRSMVMSEDERRLTAYHESGHAIIGRLVPGHDPVHKVTIIPRGRALGVTMFLPEDDRYSQTRENLESRICTMYGGRLAEEIIFGPDKVTTGAQNDIERATELARNMVTRWGLSDKMGPLAYAQESDEVFLGHAVTQHKTVSDHTSQEIDTEVRDIIDKSYQRARSILLENINTLHAMAEALLKYETIDGEQINDLMAGKEPRPPSDWDDDTGTADPKSDTDPRPSAEGDDSQVGETAEQH